MPELIDKEREMVLAVRSDAVADLFAVLSRVWYPCADESKLDAWLAKSVVAFLPRIIAESDDSWRHFCTYTVLRSGSRYFTYRRGTSGSEGRLHGKLSLGVGGHVGIEDYITGEGVWSESLSDAVLRELDEELATGSVGFSLAGLIADDSTAVNRVHLGAVYLASVDSDRVYPREDCLAEPEWLTAAELLERRGEMEAWSQIVVDRLIGGGA